MIGKIFVVKLIGKFVVKLIGKIVVKLIGKIFVVKLIGKFVNKRIISSTISFAYKITKKIYHQRPPLYISLVNPMVPQSSIQSL